MSLVDIIGGLASPCRIGPCLAPRHRCLLRHALAPSCTTLNSEFNSPDPKRLRTYWKEVQSFVVELYGSRLATVARLNGHTVTAKQHTSPTVIGIC